VTANRWYDFKNTADDSAEVFIYDEIGGWGIDAASFVRELRAYSGKALTVRVHSPGGSVLDGHAIFNALKRHNGGVTVQIDGLAASMASVIAMAGAPVKMAANGFLMIHNPSGGMMGGADDMRKAAELLDKMKDGLVNIYAAKSGKSAEEIEEWMDAETWFTADEAKENGLIDEITDGIAMAAKFDAMKNFSRVPVALVDTPREAMDATALSAELTTARESLTIAQAQAQKNFADFTAKVAEVENLKSEVEGYKAKLEAEVAKLSALNEDNSKLKTDLENAQNSLKEVTAQANAKITAELAKAGHEPVGGEVKEIPSAEDKKDFSHLKGRERVAAAIKAQFSK